MQVCDELVRRMNVALAEVGYGSPISLHPWDLTKMRVNGLVPNEVLYKAMVLADPYEDRTCYDCWMTGIESIGQECLDGNCRSTLQDIS